MKKIVIGIVALVVISGGIFWGVNQDRTIGEVSANPDFICKKSVTGYPCEVVTCEDWTAGQRNCTGKRTTEVSYHLIRTSCESGYTKVIRGSANGSSGRQGADYVSGDESCTITQYDTVAPTGEVK